MIESIISGIGLGIVLSFVTGPVFFALIKTSIEKGFYAGLSLAGGVFLSDLFYVALSIYGSSFMAFENKFRLPIGIAGSVVLLSIGIYYLFKKVKINYKETTSRKHNTGYFFKGFLMCILNPSLLLYWISVTSGIISVRGQLDPDYIIPFFGSILLTQFSTDALKAYYANKLRYRIKETTIIKLNKIAGSLIIIFAIRLIYSLIFSNSIL
ncbi:LysE family translocator [Rubrolithibacter danxiaensis]|uniref:LysE family translocator n=1 Tax=Rubrolithibacter danxiaensis TaxID=3390805 RepID=UPI003BF7BBD0